MQNKTAYQNSVEIYQEAADLIESIKSGKNKSFNLEVAKFKGEEQARAKYSDKLFTSIIKDHLEQDFIAWCKFFLPNHFTDATPDFHYEVIELLFEKKKKKMALAAPRGTAKSTLVTLAYPLYCILVEAEPNIILISINQGSCNKLLSNVKRELMMNERIEFFYGNKRSAERWSDSEFIWDNTICTAFGLGVPIRVSKFGSARPTLAIIDDIETREIFTQIKGKSQDEMLQYRDYIYREVEPAMDPKLGKIRYVGTIFHPDAILPSVMANRSYFARSWSIICNENTPEEYSLWPERWSIETLKETRATLIEQNQASVWYSEYMNQPIAKETRMFNSPARYGYEEMLRIKDQLIFFQGFDLATGKGHDKTSSVIIARDSEMFGNFYIVDVFNKRCEIDDGVAAILNLTQKWKPLKVVTQNDLMAITNEKYIRSEAIRMGIDLSLELTKSQHQSAGVAKQGNSQRSKLSKEQRLTALVPIINSGKLKVLADHKDLIEQIEKYPYVAYDDLLDALLEAVTHSWASDKMAGAVDQMEADEEARRLAFQAIMDKLAAQKELQMELSSMNQSREDRQFQTDSFGRWEALD